MPTANFHKKPANAQRRGFFLGFGPGAAGGLARFPSPRRNQPDRFHRFIAGGPGFVQADVVFIHHTAREVPAAIAVAQGG